jgi:ribosomal-protein-alanine N-acetyltransferase
LTDAKDLGDVKRRSRLEVASNCHLRPLGEADVTAAYVDGLNDPVVNKYLVGTRRQRQTLASVRAYVRANDASETDVLFGIFIDDMLRGTVRLHAIDPRDGSARVGILLFDRACWGQGWATRAIRAVLTFGSDVLRISTFHAGMRADNKGSARTFAGLGFRYVPEDDWTDESNVTHHFWLMTLTPRGGERAPGAESWAPRT